MEIERKFLVYPEHLPKLTQGVKIIQGYLAETPSVRFRIIDNQMVIAIKDYYSEGKRFELETPAKMINWEEIVKLQQLAICPPIVKVRYKVNFQDLIWEIDIYQGENEGLITAEVELPSEDYPLVFPLWVNKEKEITGDLRYSNLNLGRRPFSQWKVSK
ncbi:MAG TPA: adenylate cyclase [Peptococcaceae bacterium]|nr:adenylate cyclase [Peptococcaceae bacterium]